MASRLLKLLIPLAATLFALGAGELLCRAVLVGDDPPNHLERAAGLPMRLRPNFEGRIWGMPVHTNSRGFRGEAAALPPDAAFSILSLGDSIGFGVGVEAAAHYSQVAERALATSHPQMQFEALNAGSQGYSPSSYLVYYRNEGRALRPDLVLVEIELSNDISDEALLEWEPDLAEPSLPRAVRGGRYVVAWDGNLLGAYTRGPYWYEKTYLWSVVSRMAFELWERTYPNPLFKRSDVGYYRIGFDQALLTEERIEEGRRRLFAALSGLKTLLTRDGVQLFVLIVPARVVYEDAASDQQRFARELVEDAAAELRAGGIPHLDLRDALRADGARFYLDSIHLNPEGNAAVGLATAKAIEAQFLAPSPASD